MKSISMIIGFLGFLGSASAIPITEHDAGSVTSKREISEFSFETGSNGLPYALSPMIFAGTVGGYDVEFNVTFQEIVAHAQILYPDIIFNNATTSASHLVPRNKVLPPSCCPVTGQVTWGPADPAVISSGIRYLQNGNSQSPFITGPCGVAATSCVRISCSYDTTIWLCNDNNYPIYPACTYLATYA